MPIGSIANLIHRGIHSLRRQLLDAEEFTLAEHASRRHRPPTEDEELADSAR
jgi:hypothetical protein